jgi:hypothetical protein
MLRKRGCRAAVAATPALKTGRFTGEPSPTVKTMYIASMDLEVGVTGSSSSSSAESSSAGALGVRTESGRFRRDALPSMALATALL